MGKSTFNYVVYIRATSEKVWDALTKSEFTQQYWCNCRQDCTWVPGSNWKLMIPDGRAGDAGEVLEADKPRRLALRWRNEFMPALREEGFSICTMLIEPADKTPAKLTITHEMDRPKSKFIDAVSNGWPMILSSLKSLLETGDSLEATKQWPKGV
jgi:uncharacterized protein YndB with AHSA1/START domain